MSLILPSYECCEPITALDTVTVYSFDRQGGVRLEPGQDIRSVWALRPSKRSARTFGTLALGSVGGMVGLAYGSSREDASLETHLIYALGGYAIGAFVGYVLGDLTGVAEPSWEQIYP